MLQLPFNKVENGITKFVFCLLSTLDIKNLSQTLDIEENVDHAFIYDSSILEHCKMTQEMYPLPPQ